MSGCTIDTILDQVLHKGCTVSFYPGKMPNQFYISIKSPDKQIVQGYERYGDHSRICPKPPMVNIFKEE